ncbi:hypothetical protein E3E36_02100 [Thermococcus sp. M36]|uniref:hypothetical protein n=1 Tax=Thermococcus sp. M36 TaxID=1638261 RepID=UPI0014392B3B|nr:hypothetical protein [Thermococcus sp. M36]NJE04960.1 hypothetical protein [Thermococcus sp. M36]
MKRAVGYVLVLTASLYAITGVILRSGVSLTPSLRLLAAFSALLISFLISRAFYPRLPGMDIKGESISHVLALMFPLYALSLIGVLYFGPERFMEMTLPP